MSCEVSASGGNFTPCPAGLHPAICTAVIPVGTQTGSFKGTPKLQSKVVLSFEVCTPKMADGKPYTINAYLTASISDNAVLRQFLKSRRGRDFTADELKKFDLHNVVGVPCQINVLHEDNKQGGVRDMIQGVLPKAAGFAYPPPVNPLIKFSLKNWDQAAYDRLPEWIKKKIAASPEGAAKLTGGTAPAAGTQTAAAPSDSEIPF